jgi:hypothetical protein
MNLGAEDKKKLRWLAVLGVIMAIAVYSSFFSDSSPAPRPAGAVSERNQAGDPFAPQSGAPTAKGPTRPRPLVSGRSRGDEFHPSLRPKREEDRQDPATIDPTLRLELLAKVQDVKLEGGQRNLFQFGPATKLEGPDPKIVPKVAEMYGPHPAPPPPPPPAPPPPPPPTPFTPKYYGLATKQIDGKKTAFFLDGDEIVLATEGMLVKRRFKVMRITATSVVVQDVETKRDQTIQISEDAGGNGGNTQE